MTLNTLLLYLLAINALTFLLYGLDKRAARNGSWRIPEKSLHLAAILGGSPAALIAQQLFRHKRRKGNFMVWYWLIVVFQVAGIAYYLARNPQLWAN
jgi:uncharacterized membrane protein YsdA (DUF1294 family)